MKTKQLVALVIGVSALGVLVGAGAVLLADSDSDNTVQPATSTPAAPTTPPSQVVTTLPLAATTTPPVPPDGLADRLAYADQVNVWMTRIEALQSTIGPGVNLAVFDAAITDLDGIYAEVEAYPTDSLDALWFTAGGKFDSEDFSSSFTYVCDPFSGSFNPIERYAKWAPVLAWWDSALAGAPNDEGAVADEPSEIEYALDRRTSVYETTVACREATETWIADTHELAATYDLDT